MSWLISMMDRYAVEDWRQARKWASTWVAVFWVVVGVVFALLALISDEVKNLIGVTGFSIAFLVTGVSFGVARLAGQPGTKEDD